jgi:hypothetical protein
MARAPMADWEWAAIQKIRANLLMMKLQLERQGYKVIEVPSFRVDDIYFNYTNSIVSKKFAITSELGIKVWDDYVRGVFKELGYETHALSVAQESLCYSGGVRCLSEIYRKAPSSADKPRIR